MDHICISWKKLGEMKKTDCECLIHNFGYAVKQNHEKPEEEFPKVMTAAMEHHFDNHEYCNPSWCHFREDSIHKSDDTVWKAQEYSFQPCE